MSRSVLTNLDLNKNEIQNAVLQPLATAPANPKFGQVYTNSNDKIIYQYDGEKWKPVWVSDEELVLCANSQRKRRIRQQKIRQETVIAEGTHNGRKSGNETVCGQTMGIFQT